MKRMRFAMTLSLSLFLISTLIAASGSHSRVADAVAVAPSITISDAVGTTIYTSGQTPRTVNVAWNAGSDYSHCEIYFTVNGANQLELGRGHDGVKPLTVADGNTYHLWMVVYPGGGQFRVVTELTVVAQGQIELESPPAGEAGPKIGNTARDRDPLARKKTIPSSYHVAINNVRIERGPKHVIIRFKGPANQTPYVAIGRGPAVTRNNELVFGDNLVGGGFLGPGTVTDAEKAAGQYMFASAFGTTFSDDALEPGGTYYYLITIPAGAGKPPYQATDKFIMAGEATTVRLVWDRVLVEDDSDDLSSGDLYFWFWANHGQSSAKSSDYLNYNADSDHSYDVRETAVIDNAPRILVLSASGRDDDSGYGNSGFEAEGFPEPLSGPLSRSTKDENVARGEFDLTRYATGTRVPFRLNSMSGGALKFVIFGYFDVTRVTVEPGSSGNSENIGTSSSGLTAAPSPQPVKAGPRVKNPDGTIPKSTLTKCEAARLARERNSPAAPGLEPQCAAEGVKPAARVRLPDGTTSKSTLTKCEAAKLARARNSPAAPGLEAQCIEEQKR